MTESFSTAPKSPLRQRLIWPATKPADPRCDILGFVHQ